MAKKKVLYGYVIFSTLLNALFVLGAVRAAYSKAKDKEVTVAALGRRAKDLALRYSRRGVAVLGSRDSDEHRLFVSRRPETDIALGEWFPGGDPTSRTDAHPSVAVYAKNFLARWYYDERTNCYSVAVSYNGKFVFIDRDGKEGLHTGSMSYVPDWFERGGATSEGGTERK